jgi:hypothetical protein
MQAQGDGGLAQLQIDLDQAAVRGWAGSSVSAKV